MISKVDSKPFQVRFVVGHNKTNKVSTVYGDWQTLYGIIDEPSGSTNTAIYGITLNFDRIVRLNAGSISRQINYQTQFIIDNMPTSVYESGDYKVKYIYPEINGEIVIGLDKIDTIDIPKLYFYSNNTLLYYQINFDKDKLVAYVKKREPIPFDTGDYVWTRQPADSETTDNRLLITDNEETGFSDTSTQFIKLTFIEAENG